MSKYFGHWGSYEDVLHELSSSGDDFRDTPPNDFPKEDKVLFAVYESEWYEGSAAILYMKDGKLMEWQDGHCSCRGLEWNKGGGETTWAALALRPRDAEPFYSCPGDAKEYFWHLVDAHTIGIPS